MGTYYPQDSRIYDELLIWRLVDFADAWAELATWDIDEAFLEEEYDRDDSHYPSLP